MTNHSNRRDDEQFENSSFAVDRRNFLRCVGGASAITLAGCTGPSSVSENASPTVSVGGDEGDPEVNAETDAADAPDVNQYLPDSTTVSARTTDDGDAVFDRPVVTVRVGGTVTWSIEDGVHTVTAYHPDTDRPRRIPDDAEPFDSGSLQAGETFERTFETPGVYNYYCAPHEGMGMVGTVVVGDPTPTDQAALTEPQQSLPQPARDELAAQGVRARSSLTLPAVANVDVTSGDGGAFAPAVVHVRSGGTVVWTLDDGVHTVTSYHPSNDRPRRVPDGVDAFDSGRLSEEGATFERVFETEGVHDYFCIPHEGVGMVGTVVVGDPGGDQPGLSAPQESLPDATRTAIAENNEAASRSLESDRGTTGGSPEAGEGNESTDAGQNQTDSDANQTASDGNATGNGGNATDGGGSGTGETPPDGAESIDGKPLPDGDVTAKGTSFSPSRVTVDAGERVTWVIGDGVHTVTSSSTPDGADSFDSGLQERGATYSRRFSVPGTYSYYCAPHRSAGMTGTIVVKGSEETGQPSPQPDDEEQQPEKGEQNSGEGQQSSAAAGDAAATVSLRGEAFEPSLVRVAPGESVAWAVEDGVHTVTAYHPGNGKNRRIPDGADSFDSGFLETGDTFERTFETEGVYGYYCAPHEGMGMVGAVVVGDPKPSPEAQPGLTKPRSDVLAPTAVRALNDAAVEALGGPVGDQSPDAPAESGGEGSNIGETPNGGDADSTAAVAAGSSAFSPAIVRVDPGEAVTWTVEESVHTVTAYHSDNGKTARIPNQTASFDSGMLRTDESFTHTFETEGVYDYFCTPHEGTGMVGTVVVGDPNPTPEAEPGLRAPADDVAAPETVRSLNTRTIEALGGTMGEAATDGNTSDGSSGGDNESSASGSNSDTGTDNNPGSGNSSSGGDDTGDADGDGPTDRVGNYGFSPAVLRVDPDESITWKIDEGVHSITAYHPDNDKTARVPEGAASFDSGMLQAGESFTHSFETEGVYDYFCVPHEGMGMVGTVIVGDPDPAPEAEPGLRAPADDVAAPDAISELNATAIETLGGTPPERPAGDTSDEEGSDAGTGGEPTAGTDEEPAANAGDNEIDGELADVAEVSIPDRRFAPDLVRIAVGGTVQWTFDEGGHTVTAYEDRIPPSAEAFDSGLKGDGTTFERGFEVEGIYDYYCMPHAAKGMAGTVIVGNPDPEGDHPGLSEPSQSGDEGAALRSLNTRAVETLTTGGEGGDYQTVDAETLDDVDGVIDIQVQTDDGSVQAGGEATIVARFEGARLANAVVEVEGDDQGKTGEDGSFVAQIPDDLDADDECRFEIRVDGARGRIEAPVVE